MRTYTITAFPNIYQKNNQIRLCYSWDTLCKFLGKKREPVDKLKQISWSPAIFDGDRANENAIKLSCLVVDVDDHVLLYTCGSWMYMSQTKCYIHTSVSHTIDKNKYRVILPLAEDAPAEDWRYYHAALKTWWTGIFKDAPFDLSTKDQARLYFVGYNTAEYSEQKIEGKILDWKSRAQDERVKYEEELRLRRNEQEERLRRAEQNRKNYGNISYSDKRLNMYTVLRNSEVERRRFASFLGTRDAGDRAIKWRCPKCGQDDATYFYYDPTRYPSAYCNHRNSCNWKESLGYLAELNGYF